MAYNPFSLEGKTILVTGASSGIGRGISVECSKMGAKMVINGRNMDRLNETLALLEGEGHIAIQADLSKQEDIDKIFAGMPDKESLIGKLAEMYNEPIMSLMDEPDEKTGNVEWVTSW